MLIAQLATAAGVRAPLAHVANQVFLDLTNELRAQGLGHKVIADMFGLALRTYHAKIQRLSESATDKGRSLWEAVLEFVADKGSVRRAEIFRRFRYDNEATVRGVLRDLTESGMIFKSGRGDSTVYRAADEEEIANALLDDPIASASQVAWVLIHREGPLSRHELAERLRLDPADVDPLITRLVDEGQIEADAGGDELVYKAGDVVISYDTPVGWEAAVFDHYQALVAAIGMKLRIGQTRALPSDAIGGSTYVYDIWPGHPLEAEVLGFLRGVREQASELRERVDTLREQFPDRIPGNQRVIFYAGQTVLRDDVPDEEE